MKKLFLGAIAAMTLAACSQEEDFETQNVEKKVNGIEYNVSTKNQTRVDASYSSKNQPSSFKVWALKNGDTSAEAYINGKTITKGNDGTYAAETADTWPGYALDFFATVNGDATITSGTAAVKDFTVNSDAAKQVDLLYAATSNVSSGTVGINFKHALSQVCFQAKNSNTNINVVLKSVGIGGLNDKGTYTLPSTSDAKGSWGTLSNSGTGLAEYTVSLGDGVTLSSEAQALGYSDSDVSGVLAVIPQKQTKLTVASGTQSIKAMTKTGAYFVLNAVVTNTDTENTTKYEGNIYVPVSIDFQEGYRYVYTLTFSTGDGGYCDNGSSLLNASMNVNYNVSTADVVDKDNTTEATTETKLTMSVNPTSDCYVRNNSSDQGKTYDTDEIELIQDATNSKYFYGLMQFTELPDPDKYTITKATLKLVTSMKKGCKTLDIRTIASYGTTYTEMASAITTALEANAVASGEVKGESGKAAKDKDSSTGATKISEAYQSVSAWTTEYDVTSAITASTVNLLLSANSDNKESFKIYTTGVSDSSKNLPSFTYTLTDLKPILVIEYAEK